MILTILAIALTLIASAVIVILTVGPGASKPVNVRLAALDQAFAPTRFEETVADIRRAESKLSVIPGLDRWLSSLHLAGASTRYLYQAGVTQSIGSLFVTSAIGFVVVGCVLYFRFREVLPALLLATGIIPMPFLYVRWKRKQRLGKLEQQLPEALGMMVSALRVGHSLVASLGAVAQESPEPIAGEMRKCFEEQNFGVDLRTALINLTDRAPIQDLRIFVAAVLIQKESGGNLAEVLEKVANTTRDRFRLKKQVSVHTAQGRMTGWILSLLPVALGVGMYFMNPGSMSVLWTRPVGLKLLYTAVGMDLVGAMIIRKIVSIRV